MEVERAAGRLVHHYYCTLPTEGENACAICSAIEDPTGIGTLGVMVEDLRVALAARLDERDQQALIESSYVNALAETSS